MIISPIVFGSVNSRKKTVGGDNDLFLTLKDISLVTLFGINEDRVKKYREDSYLNLELHLNTNDKVDIDTLKTLSSYNLQKYNEFIYEIQKVFLKVMKCEYMKSSIRVMRFHYNGIKRYKKDDETITMYEDLNWEKIHLLWKNYTYEFGVLIFGNVINNWKLNGNDEWKKERFKELYNSYKNFIMCLRSM